MKRIVGPTAVILISVVLALLLAGCGQGSAEAGKPQISDRPTAANFTVATGPTSSFSLSEHTGEIVVLYFSFPG